MRHFSKNAVLVGLLTWSLWPQFCRAAIVLGVDHYVENAELVLLLQAQTRAEADAFPAPEGKTRLRVLEVLKGITTEQCVIVPAGEVAAGGKAIFVVNGELPYAFCVSPKPRSLTTFCWPMDEKGKLETYRVPARSSYFGIGREEEPTLELVRKAIADKSPEEVGLHAQVLDAYLFPKKHDDLLRKDPRRAGFVRFMAALCDLDRDVKALAALLESTDGALRSAAEKRLRHVTGTNIDSKGAKLPAQLHAYAGRWRKWWDDNRAELSWNEKNDAWAKQADALPWPRRWPALPMPLKIPAAHFPDDVIQALDKADRAAFAKALRRWLDAGVMRDRQIIALRYRPGKTPGTDLVADGKIKPQERMETIALASLRWHHDRYAAERRDAMAMLPTAKVEAARRAAFWELFDCNTNSAGSVAIKRIAGADDVESQKALAASFLAGPESDLLSAGRESISKGHKVFSDILLRHAKESRDKAAGWACWAFCLENKREVVPVLIDWINDPSPEARSWVGHNLNFFPEAGVVPDLIAALEKEKDDQARSSLLRALAATADKRGLDLLIAAATREKEAGTLIPIARALGKIGDKRALPALAAIAERSENEQVHMMVVNAFGHVSGLYKGYPDASTTIETDRLREGLAAIAKWRQEQKK